MSVTLLRIQNDFFGSGFGYVVSYFQIQGSDPDLDQTGIQKGIV
jgi:hypothetical protein